MEATYVPNVEMKRAELEEMYVNFNENWNIVFYYIYIF